MKTQNIYFILLLVFMSKNECQACFSYNQFQNISIKTGNAFYRECHCKEDDGSVQHLTWLDPQGKEIGTLGPGTDLKMYTERRDRSLSLLIPNVSRSMSGAYKCVTIYNGIEYVSTYEIDAYDPLYFVNTGEHQSIIKGLDGTISCQARGKTEPLIIWYKGRDAYNPITDNTKYQNSSEGLLVRNVTDKDADIYKCTARVMDTGEEVDRYIKVEVDVVPVIKELKAIPEKTVVVGETLSIECIANGLPRPEYNWNKTSEPRPSDNKNVTWYQDKKTIIFSSVEPDDRGFYECVAFNRAGVAKKNIFIEVFVPPTIIEFANTTAVEGSRAQIICKATGRSRPKIYVKFEGEEPDGDTSIKDIRKTSNIESVFTWEFIKLNKSHDGYYTCNASNEVDYVTEQIHLTVLHAPYFEKPFENIWGWNGKSVNLSCKHESNPPSNITWRFLEVEPQSKVVLDWNKLLIEKLNSEQKLNNQVTLSDNTVYGVFECTASNDIGKSKKSIYLKEGFKPSAVKNVTTTDITATSATFLIVGPDAVNGPPVIGFTSEYDTEENYSITNIHENRTWAIDRPNKVQNLKPNTTYHIKFAAINDVGAGMWSDTIVFKTPEKSVPDSPVWKDAVNNNDSNLLIEPDHNEMLKWKTPESNGDPIDHYLIKYCPVQDSEIDVQQCKTEWIEAPTTEYNLNQLNVIVNTTYYVELMAHNSVGYSTTTSGYLTPLSLESAVTLSAGAIIGLAIVVALICVLMLDLLVLWWKKQGIIASCCLNKNKKRKAANLRSRDKKGLLKDKAESTGDTLRKHNNGHKEYEYNKTTGVVTGKHSAV